MVWRGGRGWHSKGVMSGIMRGGRWSGIKRDNVRHLYLWSGEWREMRSWVEGDQKIVVRRREMGRETTVTSEKDR